MHKKTSIYVNGINYFVDKKDFLSFEEIIIYAFGSYQENNYVTYTVTYSRAHGNKKGLLVKGQKIKVKEGMVFCVTCTNKS